VEIYMTQKMHSLRSKIDAVTNNSLRQYLIYLSKLIKPYKVYLNQVRDNKTVTGGSNIHAFNATVRDQYSKLSDAKKHDLAKQAAQHREYLMRMLKMRIRSAGSGAAKPKFPLAEGWVEVSGTTQFAKHYYNAASGTFSKSPVYRMTQAVRAAVLAPRKTAVRGGAAKSTGGNPATPSQHGSDKWDAMVPPPWEDAEEEDDEEDEEEEEEVVLPHQSAIRRANAIRKAYSTGAVKKHTPVQGDDF
jgi:hypothetical protein